MQASTRTLIALAFAAALSSPAVFAQARHPGGVATPPAATAKLDARSSDAVSGRTTGLESAPNALGSGATVTTASAVATNPGKGNWWTDADADADGRLSKTEAAANAGLDARFGSIDTDKDGFVTQDEYRTYFTANASQGEQHASANATVVSRALWLKLDADADSKISLAEAIGDPSLSSSFTKMDGNSDGFITQAEYTAYAKLHR